MEKILITGSNGKIGQALTCGLEDTYEIIPYDLPEHDATNYRELTRQLIGCTALIHLAFDLQHENSRTGRSGNPENLLMSEVALAAAAKSDIDTCIMASSVNTVRTDNETNWAYRTTKQQQERLTEEQSIRYPHVSFYSIRFGRVTIDDTPPTPPLRPDQTWLSHRDATNLVRACIEHSSQNHQTIYGVSNRSNMPYDITNNIGWQPQDSFGE